jgi:hypothetical protein
MRVKAPRDGYVRCDTLMPALECQIAPIPDMPVCRAFCLLTVDGGLAPAVTVHSAQYIADMLRRAAARMREAS